jgi:hypothetical protein
VSEHDDLVYLDHIDTMSAALTRSANRGKEISLTDADVRDATIYRLQTLAESTQRLSTEFKSRHPRSRGMTSPDFGIEQYTGTWVSTSKSCGTSWNATCQTSPGASGMSSTAIADGRHQVPLSGTRAPMSAGDSRTGSAPGPISGRPNRALEVRIWIVQRRSLVVENASARRPPDVGDLVLRGSAGG